ncbi:CBS domain-containing protein [Mesorhizobium ventifaucium]|nr:CBS domain-containing protein [Mesorhizobium ventifaucium]
MSIRLQQELIRHACQGIPTTYRQLLRSVGTVAGVDETLVRASLERLMDEDTIAARPFVTALVIGPQAGGLSEPWFFSKARKSGRLVPLSDELEAWAFHARELQRAVSYYRTLSSNAAAARWDRSPGVGIEGAVKMLMAKDVMTADVITVASDTTIRTVAELLVTQGISGVPVLDDDVLVGIVTEEDLLHRAEIGTAARPVSWWSRIFKNKAVLAAAYSREHSTRVVDVMTKNVVTVEESTPIADIADLLAQRKIRRVPVMRGGKVVGIVSRANIVRALAATANLPRSACRADDETIRQHIQLALRDEAWPSASTPNFTVKNGVVSFWGTVESDAERDALRVLCENIPGVQKVEDHRMILSFPTVAVCKTTSCVLLCYEQELWRIGSGPS